ncbi:MAG: ATP-grasp domain-containing protein [Acidimicrobiales bacterium]|nr:ATP-grasp domain-containing protein [Acidimicrobiales bacterium]
MKVLLSDGSGLTARQCATRLAADGHPVEALAPDPLCLCRFTRAVRRVRRVPPYGSDPIRWLTAAVGLYRSGRFDVLFPTLEQVAVLSWARDTLHDVGVATAVPPFSSVAAVQDKVSAYATLDRLGIPQPASAVDAADWDLFPAFVKEPIGTASGGVRRVSGPRKLAAAANGKTVLIQAATPGALVMCQSVFDDGSIRAFHACQRIAEGASGGASHKLSVSLPEVGRWLELLGTELRWHGALSADVILSGDGPVFIDLNPRLVEPENAFISGVDLVGAMMELATGGHPLHQPEGRAGTATHQLLLALLGAAQHGEGRRKIAAELVHAARRTDGYRTSLEELTPLHHDPKALIPLVMATAATLVAPGTWRWFTSGSVANYALSDEGWHKLLATDPAGSFPAGYTSPLST